MRDGALFNYNMFAYLDGDFFYKAVEYLHKGGKPDQLKSTGVVARPDEARRGAVDLRRALRVHALLLAQAAQPADDARGALSR